MSDAQVISGLRASDRDRQQIVDRLRDALDDGRLTLEEYLDRMGRAYQAVTYADLAPLCADLPAAGRRAASATAPAATGVSATGAPAAAGAPAPGWWCGAFGRQPRPLRVMWAIWLIAVSVNVVVWALVSLTTTALIYPWPLWVAGPWGAWLAAMSVAAAAVRRVPRGR